MLYLARSLELDQHLVGSNSVALLHVHNLISQHLPREYSVATKIVEVHAYLDHTVTRGLDGVLHLHSLDHADLLSQQHLRARMHSDNQVRAVISIECWSPRRYLLARGYSHGGDSSRHGGCHDAAGRVNRVRHQLR